MIILIQQEKQLVEQQDAKLNNQPIDYYIEDGNIIFTEHYHLKRGMCCGNGCMHCPYEPKSIQGNKNIKKQLLITQHYYIFRYIKLTIMEALTGYCLKTKQKNVPFVDAVIKKTKKGGYMVQGHDGSGNKMSAMLNEEKALSAIANGLAKQDF